jgi:hypothetical protein
MSSEEYIDDEYEEPEEDEHGGFIEWPRDPRLDPAKAEAYSLFEQNPSMVFYGRQVEVILEKGYFHWITHKALRELTGEGSIRSELRTTAGGNRLRLYWSRQNRYPKRAATVLVKRVDEHANPELTKAIGAHAEMLFGLAASMEGFRLRGRSMRAYSGKEWRETDHDLDWIFERDGVGWGVEVKNTWAYIDRAEMHAKIRMCGFLGLKPLFIMRWAPKSYVELIRRAGGFGLLYETQLFPLGHRDAVGRLRELRLPVVEASLVPDGVFKRFVKHGHEKALPRELR